MGSNCCAQSAAGENGSPEAHAVAKGAMIDKSLLHAKTIDQMEQEKIHKPAPELVTKTEMLEIPKSLQSILQKRGEFKPPDECLQELAADMDDLPELGPFRYIDGTTYFGQYRKGLRYGKGIQFFPAAGLWYEGLFRDDHPDLYGRFYTLTNGQFTEGTHMRGIATGEGEILYREGGTYRGGLLEGKPHGTGVEFVGGNRYEGKFRRGVRNGMGVMHYEDGSKYEGEFVNRAMHGRGRYEWNDKRVYEGDFKLNQMDGQGVFSWPDGRRYVGEYKKDKKHGYGEFTFKDGRVYRGNWIDGRQDGVGEISETNGKVSKGIWKDGTKIR